MDQVSDDICEVMLAAWSFWPFINVFNFMVVVGVWKVLVDSIAGTIWGTYLCWVLHRPQSR